MESSTSICYEGRSRKRQRLQVVDMKGLVFEGIDMLFRTPSLKEKERQRTEIEMHCSQRDLCV